MTTPLDPHAAALIAARDALNAFRDSGTWSASDRLANAVEALLDSDPANRFVPIVLGNPFEPRGAFDVHFGLKRNHCNAVMLAAIEAAADPALRERTVFVDGDGWNSWGEAPGTDVNDADTLHVVIRCTSLGEAILTAQAVKDAYDHLIVPSSGYPYPNGNTIAAVTSAVDHADLHYAITTAGEFTYASRVDTANRS